MDKTTVSKVDTKDPVFQSWLKEVLHDQQVEDLCITFVKKNGDERKMYCTLAEGRIPSDKQPKGETTRATSQEVQPVFDVDVGEWRSFRWDAVKSVEFNL